MLAFLRTLFLRSGQEFAGDGCPQMAAAISYYVLFSLFPLLIFVAGVLGLFLQDDSVQKDVTDLVLNNTPLGEGEGREAVTKAVQGASGPGSGLLGVIGLLGTAWGASGMFAVTRSALDKTSHTRRRRPFVQQKLLDLALVLGIALFFLASIAATAVLRVVRLRSEEMAGIGQLADETGYLWDAVSYLLPLVFSFAAFAVLYTVVPQEIRRWRDVWPGALFAAIAFEVAKTGLSLYVEHFANFDVVFGSLGAVASFLFWVYVSANIMLFGAEMASVRATIPSAGYEQPQMQGLRPPLRTRVLKTVRGLFVQGE